MRWFIKIFVVRLMKKFGMLHCFACHPYAGTMLTILCDINFSICTAESSTIIVFSLSIYTVTN
jgi:hypothetical protein